MLAYVGERRLIALGGAGGHIGGDPVALEAIEELGHRDLSGFDSPTVLGLGDQSGGFDLGLPLGAAEAHPAASALTGDGIAGLKNDGPAAGRALADMASHGYTSLLFSIARAAARSSISCNTMRLSASTLAKIHLMACTPGSNQAAPSTARMRVEPCRRGSFCSSTL